MEDKDPATRYRHGSWCDGNARGQGISSFGENLTLPEYSNSAHSNLSAFNHYIPGGKYYTQYVFLKWGSIAYMTFVISTFWGLLINKVNLNQNRI